MNAEEFEHRRREIIARNASATSSRLSCFVEDALHALHSCGLFGRVGWSKTGHAPCALVLWCSVADPKATREDVAQVLARLWSDDLRFDDEHALRITMQTGEVQAHFATASGGEAITGRIEVMGFDERGASTCLAVSH